MADEETLREFLEARWAERRGKPITEALEEFGVPYGKDDPDSIDWVGAERVRDREIRWAERGKAIDAAPPEEFVRRLLDYEDFFGALWLDAFVAGMAFATRAQR